MPHSSIYHTHIENDVANTIQTVPFEVEITRSIQKKNNLNGKLRQAPTKHTTHKALQRASVRVKVRVFMKFSYVLKYTKRANLLILFFLSLH